MCDRNYLYASVISETDDLNVAFERAESIDELNNLYLSQADLFYLDKVSGGKRERQEQFIKFMVMLLSPKED